MSRRVEALAAEPFTLALSAGFFGFYAHTGVLLALEQAGLKPRRVVGASAGAIAGGMWAAGLSGARLAEILTSLRREDFWDPTWQRSRPEQARDPGTAFGLLRGRKFDRLLADALAEVGVENIEDCAVSFAGVTHELRRRRTVVHERGPIRPVIRASAALPLMFGPVRVAGTLHADGGISDRPAFSALAADERCLYHHLPHRSRWPRVSGSEADDRRESVLRMVVVHDELPRVNPMALDQGRRALESAREQTLRWLDGRSG
ncbi:patatin-like phospholipase family protein [Pseudenhygromyxa sp. WMMC2535]|uniref:patatin-like phospholipase family protein n=1 Tax=Pseudenhygromyxa sp. WMMC2535 TaxID=2712867 RepID=UPI0015518A97|nr:patatin-like phospholipase family protein [Pseudenhygromyxa sp. WMMC2535]NVB38086.1 patatin-like phospholipase family protein [Pseudenhygromyxa sp. WMMC2535]